MSTSPPTTEHPRAPDLVDVSQLVVGVLGGTGPQGRGLAVRLAAAGQRILLGSRDAEARVEVAAEVAGRAAAAPAGAEVSVTGGSNVDVAGAADLVIVAVPFAGHAATLAELAAPLAGKVVVDCVVPMGFDELGAYVLDVEEGQRRPAGRGAAARQPRRRGVPPPVRRPARGPVPAHPGRRRHGRRRRPARRPTSCRRWPGGCPGMRGIYAGRLRNARQVEALTVNLVSVNRRYKVHAGVRVTDV